MNRYVHALWCDDIRQEIGNKPSFMGVYTGGLVLPSAPIVIPKLCVFVWLVTPTDEPFRNLKIRLHGDDGTDLASLEIAEGDMPKRSEVRPGATRTSINVAVIAANVEITPHTQYFGIEVVTESETLVGPKLFLNIDPNLNQQTQGPMARAAQ